MKRPSLSFGQELLLGASIGPSGAQNDQKVGKSVSKLSFLEILFQGILSTGSRDINNDKMKRPPVWLSQELLLGGLKRALMGPK